MPATFMTRKDYDEVNHLLNICNINGAKVEPVDVIIGGSPCQDLSVAGKRAGLDGERSGLFLEQIRIIKEMRDATNGTSPRYMVWENVPGAFSSNKGEDFRIVLEETAKIADETAVIPRPDKGKWSTSGAIMGDGWSIAWRVFDAQFWGVPQRRRRIALVADFGGQSAPEILFERKSVSGDIAESGAEGQGVAGDVERSIDTPIAVVHDARGNGDGSIAPTMTGDHQNRVTDYTGIIAAVDCRNFNETGETFGTLQAKPNGGQSLNYSGAVRQEQSVRRLTPLECERLQGFPDNWTNIPPQANVTEEDLTFWRTVWDEWDDMNGKKRHSDKQIIKWLQSEPADSARYKALGNSIALPPWRFVLSRIHNHGARTMASLFDGIGGFPKIWQELGGQTLWASEVEPFPILVTRYRFKEVHNETD